jgi:uncharacterized protein YoxC
MSSHIDTIVLGLLMLVLGTLVSVFFTLLWRRLDKIDATLVVIQRDMTQFYGTTQKLEGRVDEISQRVK